MTDNAFSSSLSQNLPEVSQAELLVVEFDMEAVAEMFGKSVSTVAQCLSRHKSVFPARYRKEPREGSYTPTNRIRVLSGEEVVVLAGIMLPKEKLREVRLRVGNKSQVAWVPGRVVGKAEIREEIFKRAGRTFNICQAA